MTWVALLAALVFGIGAAAAVNRRRSGDLRIWLAFSVGIGVFFAVQFTSRPVTALAASILKEAQRAPGWTLVALNTGLAELMKVTAALLVWSAHRAGHRAAGIGAAVGAGFGVLSESKILGMAFQLSRLGLPGGPSVAAALVGSCARLVAGVATTGLGADLASDGRLLLGVGLALGAQLLLDPGLRMLEGPVAVGTLVGIASVLYGWLLVRTRTQDA
jgi:hypothetical protein